MQEDREDKTMKAMTATKAFAAAAIILAGTVGIGAGTARAGERSAADKVPTIEVGGATYRVGVDIDGTWEPRVASETGAIPAAGDDALRGGEDRTGQEFPTIEVGGRTYRVGIDYIP